MDATPDELISPLWYLKQWGLEVSDDKSSLQITLDSLDLLANRKPTPEHSDAVH